MTAQAGSPAVPPPSLSKAALAIAATAAAFGLLAWAGIVFTREADRIAALWLPNAVLIAVLLRAPARRHAAYLFACLGANIAANLVAGDAIGHAMLALINTAEVVIVVLAMRALKRGRPDMTRAGDLALYSLVAGLAAPVVAGGFATVALSGGFDGGLWRSWSTADGLGNLIVAPILLILGDALAGRIASPKRPVSDWLLVLGGGSIATVIVFAQNHFPLLFLICPVTIFAAFRLGIVGTTLAITMISIVASVATTLGHGPILLIAGGLAQKLIVLQLFLATCYAMSLPVAAMLSGLETARADLKQSRDFGDEMLQNMREIVFRTDAEGRWVFLNPAWEDLTGYPVAQSLGWPTTKLLHPEDLPEASRIYPKLVSGQLNECLLHQRFVNAIGDCRHIEVSVRALRENGAFRGTIGNIRDVTARVRAEAKLAKREEQLRVLANNATDAVFVLGLTGMCLYASPSVTEVIGATPEQLVGQQVLTRFHPDDAERVIGIHGQLAAGELDRAIIAYRSEPFDKPGSWVWLEANCGLVRDAAGAPAEIVASIRDVSESKALAQELADARDAAEIAASAKANFLANMSHEIRTPMNAVIGFTELLLDGKLDAEQRHQAELIAESGKAMLQLLNDILDISKIDAGRMEINLEPVDLRHVLNGCVRLMSPLAQKKRLALRVEIDPDLPARVIGDGLRIRQIVLNLLGNALKFTHEGEVVLSARFDPTESDLFRLGTVSIAVADTGIGIPAERQAAIFEQFAQSDSSTARKYGGSGLGLAISNQLAAMMGGSLNLASVPDEGSTFRLRLPVSVTSREDAPERAPAGAGATPGRDARILVAEDHDINRMLIVAMLERLGFRPDLAMNGREAVAQAAAAQAAGAPFDFILMDVQMPEMDGLEAARRIRAAPGGDRPAIIALTANAFAEDVRACLAAGMQGHMTKPVGLEELDAMLRRHLPESGAASAPSAPIAAPIVSPALRARYEARRQETLARVDAFVRAGHFTDSEVTEVAQMLHKLSGSAGMFGDNALGDEAGRFETGLESWPESERAERIAEAAHALKAAAGR